MPRRVPTITEVDRIVALADPIVRNLQITQCYHELSLAMAEKTGSTANWCTFATWASKQAGQTIRREDLARSFENVLVRSPEVSEKTDHVVASVLHTGSQREATAIREAVQRTIRAMPAFERASMAVGRGNNKVFEEIGREFARFLTMYQDETAYDPEKILQFCDSLRPGEPPDGQRYLKQAFTRYYRALFEDDPKAKAELMFLANLEIGFHEQTRLQPEILEALNAPVADPEQLKRHLIEVVFPHPGLFLRLRFILSRLLGWRTPIDIAYGRLADRVRELARLVITEHMMTLALPNGELLRLGQDLQAHFPETLNRIADPELQALLDLVDPTSDSVYGSGAEDWADLADRIHFIADMFRAYHEQRSLFRAPFTAEQALMIKAGRKPAGRL